MHISNIDWRPVSYRNRRPVWHNFTGQDSTSDATLIPAFTLEILCTTPLWPRVFKLVYSLGIDILSDGFNSVSHNKILDLSKLKAFADD